MKHVVMFSGGAGSCEAGKRVAEKYGTDDLTLLFTDTLIEDPDLYRFLTEAAMYVGGELVQLRDGRTPWGVFRDRRLLGNSRIAPCSHELKQKPAREWVEANCDPSDTTLYVGIDWTEIHRLPSIEKGWAPYRIEAPLCEPPYTDKRDTLKRLAEAGIEQPRLYKMGFSHNNCGGGCVRAGKGHFAHLYRVLPEVFAEWEANEEAMRRHLGRDDIAILTEERNGASTPITLRELRERIDAGGAIDMFDQGGCGCFFDEPAEELRDAA
jgi:hypothetical protein